MKNICLNFIFLCLIYAYGCTSWVNQPGDQYKIRASSGGAGYEVKRINETEFSIFVEGYQNDKKERVAEFAIFHAARVTLENGYKYFSIENKLKTTIPSHRVDALLLPVGAGYQGAIIPIPFWYSEGKKVVAALVIKFLPDPGESNTSAALNAVEIEAALAKKLGMAQ